MAKLTSGETVVLILHSPREKLWGVLDEITPAGVFLRAIDLNAFEEFVRAVTNSELAFGLSDQFLPLWRVEKVLRDEPSGEIPSLIEGFERRTGRKITEF